MLLKNQLRWLLMALMMVSLLACGGDDETEVVADQEGLSSIDEVSEEGNTGADSPPAGERGPEGSKPESGNTEGSEGEGGEPAEDEGGEPAEDEGGEPVEDEGGEPVEDEGGEPAEDEGGEPAEDEGGEPAEDEGGEPAEDEGGEPAEDEGGEPAEDEGGEPAEDEGGEEETTGGEEETTGGEEETTGGEEETTGGDEETTGGEEETTGDEEETTGGEEGTTGGEEAACGEGDALICPVPPFSNSDVDVVQIPSGTPGTFTGGDVPAGTYELVRVTLYPGAMTVDQTEVPVPFSLNNLGTVGSAIFDGNSWGIQAQLDFTIEALGNFIYIQEILQGGGCFTVSNQTISGDVTQCAEGEQPGFEFPKSFEYNNDGELVQILLKFPVEGLFEALEDSPVFSIIEVLLVNDLPVVLEMKKV